MGLALAYGFVYLIELGEGCLAFRPLSILASWPHGLQASGLGAAWQFALHLAWSLGRLAVGQLALAGRKRVDGCSFRSGCYEN